MLTKRHFLYATLVLSNQHLVVWLGFGASNSAKQHALPSRRSYASHPIGLIFSLKEYKTPPHTHPRHTLKSVADSLFTQCGLGTPLIHLLVYLHFQLIASIMRSGSERSPSFVHDP